MPRLSLGLVLICLAMPVGAAQAAPPRQDGSSIDALANGVAGGGTAAEKTARLVRWINHQFAWTATDYVQRTPEQIVERRAGNCADLAKVLARLLDAVHVRYRVVREINVQPESDGRETNAERKIATGGARFSVFGRRHNDHTWLEVLEDGVGAWIPVDPAVGVVGIEEWISARLALDNRREPAVAATVPIVKAMLAPFAVVAGTEDRSAHYLIDEFDRAYDGRLQSLPAWPHWCSLVKELGPLAMGAFAGNVNLHQRSATIAEAADTYEALRQQATAAGLKSK